MMNKTQFLNLRIWQLNMLDNHKQMLTGQSNMGNNIAVISSNYLCGAQCGYVSQKLIEFTRWQDEVGRGILDRKNCMSKEQK
jgi:hypothetical protein